MKILIILDSPYPNGMACTKRIHLYAKGLLECVNQVKILIPKPTEKYGNVKNNKIKGTFEGVEFQYASNSTIRSKYFLIRRIQDFVAFIKTFIYPITFKPKIIIITSNSYCTIVGATLISFLISSKLIKEKSEVPFHWKNKLNLFDKLMLKIIYSLFDGIIVISDNLRNYFSQKLQIKAKIIQVPIIINNKIEFNKYKNTINNLVCTGSLIDHKDGIINIIEAFAKIAGKYPNISLIMTGELSHSPDRIIIKKIIQEQNIEDRVIFPGYVSEEELTEITNNAIALLLAKPNNRQNNYNMATKVGEYLLTGRPVILSKVDPATNYLSHRESALLINPEVDDLVKEIKFVLDNPEVSLEIGTKGREVALEYFDYRCQTRKLNVFLIDLLTDNLIP